ncbi:DUF488 domain-containing protein [Microvirga flavescens]|uniref:DUF488 domain-containing protein n=1 Tax=Microvirga flavescens TaxID=2249811 RepID=UPI000DD9A8A9|nr:DUF488 family protein [Microvirga flavescens]
MAHIPPDHIRLKRVYKAVTREDGQRVLVDRLWPRGMRKEDPRIGVWLKPLSPSNELRKWYGHDAAQWDEFQSRYAEELRQVPDDIAALRKVAREGIVTLVYAAQDETRNNAVALRNILLGRS